MQNFKFKFLTVSVLAIFLALLSGCTGTTPTPGNNSIAGGADPNETAATVNGKEIKLEEVERVLKQQAQGQESRLSPLELAAARLQILENLIQQEVMFQKAEKEGTVPTDEEVTAEFNRVKQTAGVSQEKFAEELTKAGQTEDTARLAIKKDLAIKKLVDKITAKIEPPKDSEIEAFYNGNKEAFVRRRGVRLAAIVIDPTDRGEGDTTKNETEATVKAKEVLTRLSQPGTDFASVARETSEDPSRLQGGDLGYIGEEELKQQYPQLATGFMDPKFSVGGVTPPVNIAGKLYIFKLQERIENQENLTLESPGVRQQITDSLINNRKQLLSQSYAAVAMNEAKIENYLARKVVETPNELSGARPADTNANAAPANASTANTNSAAANANSAANTNAAANANTKPAANAPANANASANANAAR